MAEVLPRRGFLRGLATLPLIGGAVSIIGAPVRADVSVTPHLLEAYKSWLDLEYRFLTWEMAGNREVCARYRFGEGVEKRDRCEAIRGHCSAGYYSLHDEATPSTRAAIVMTAAGQDLSWGAP